MRENLIRVCPDGHTTLLNIARHYAQAGTHDGTHMSSREDISDGPLSIPFASVSPRVLLEHAPWIEEFYKGPLLEAARLFAGSHVVASTHIDNYPLLNIHRGHNDNTGQGERYECHVDTNRPTGLYYLGEIDRTPATGGSLTISTIGDVATPADVLAACERYYPKIGEYAVMDGYGISHFVEPSTDGADRIMLVCNFWTPDIPESRRGLGLEAYQQGLA